MSDTSVEQRTAVVFAGAFAFGLYCSTFLTCLRWLLCADEGWKVRKDIRWPMLFAVLSLFTFNALYVTWDLHWTMARVWHVVHDPSGTPPFRAPGYTSIVSCTLADFTVLIADIVLIIRCWIVYGQHNVPIIILPVFLWLVALVCTILQIYLQVAHIHNPKIGPYTWALVNMKFGPGIVLMPFWISTILLNAYVSVALIHRIYGAAKQSTSPTTIDYLHSTIHIIVESGVLVFPVTLAHLLAWFGPSQFAIDVISILNAPLIGIAFNWLIIRVARNKAAEAVKEVSEGISVMKFGEAGSHRSSTSESVGHTDGSSETAVIIM